MTQAQLDVWNEAVGRAEEDPTPERLALVEALKDLHMRRLLADIAAADGPAGGTGY